MIPLKKVNPLKMKKRSLHTFCIDFVGNPVHIMPIDNVHHIVRKLHTSNHRLCTIREK